MTKNNIITPSDKYPDKLKNKELKDELDLFVKSLKDHDPENGLLDTLNYYEAMVNTGYLELQKRETSKSSKWSIILGVITTIAAFISIGLSMQATRLARTSNNSNDKKQNDIIQVERHQSEILNKISQEVRDIKSTTDSLVEKQIILDKRKKGSR